MSMLRYMQGWIGLVGFTAIGNTISCFTGHLFLSERIYTEAPSEATALAARLFGVWTLLAGILRIACAFCIDNRAIYNLTFASFILAFMHFLLEVAVYKTALINTFGVVTPLIVSGISIAWMAVGYMYLPDPYAKSKLSRRNASKRQRHDDNDESMDTLLMTQQKRR